MIPLRNQQLLAAEAVAQGQPLPDVPELRVARQLASTGQLEAALERLAMGADYARTVARWPPAASLARRRLDALPTGAPLVAALLQTVLYTGFVLLVVLAVRGVLVTQVLPKLPGAPAPALLSSLGALPVLLALGLLAVWLWTGARGWHRLPGWSRHLREARAAALLSALHETGAPDDVRAACATYPGDTTMTSAVSLEVRAHEAASRALLAMSRFVTASRVALYALLLVVAVDVVLSVYGVIPFLHLGAQWAD